MIAAAERTAWRFVDFFAVTIRNSSAREAYYRAAAATSCLSTPPRTSNISRSRGPLSGSTCPP